MPLRFLKLALKAKDLPEARVVGRVILALTGVFVLAPVVGSLLRPRSLTVTDWVGVVVLTAVGGWLIVVGVRGRG